LIDFAGYLPGQLPCFNILKSFGSTELVAGYFHSFSLPQRRGMGAAGQNLSINGLKPVNL
jgi:hypothetical protein